MFSTKIDACPCKVGEEYGWYCDDGWATSYNPPGGLLPIEILRHLAGSPQLFYCGNSVWYDTEQEAQSDLARVVNEILLGKIRLERTERWTTT